MMIGVLTVQLTVTTDVRMFLALLNLLAPFYMNGPLQLESVSEGTRWALVDLIVIFVSGHVSLKTGVVGPGFGANVTHILLAYVQLVGVLKVLLERFG